MADDSILSTEEEDLDNTSSSTEETTEYLIKDNYLSEFETDSEKAIARSNLGVPSEDDVYTKTESDTMVFNTVSAAVNAHLETEDPHGILAQVDELIDGMVKDDGSTPFLAAQSGVTPTADTHLVTKKYADKLITAHLAESDPHNILAEVAVLLQNYVTTDEVYSTSDVYTQSEVTSLLSSYVKRDGTTSFTAPQIGKDPTLDGHLATKRYADKILYKHLVDVDPHGFITTLNNRLAAYAKLKNVYTKEQTYSRSQIDSIINSAVDAQIETALEAYKEWVAEQLQDQSTFVTKDGTRAFTAAQSGVAATQDSELTTLGQVTELISESQTTLEEAIKAKECVWVTSGPVESTVGHVEDNTEVPATMTLQEVCDAIFYGNLVSITAPDYITIGTTGELTLCIHGSTALIVEAILYQDGEEIASYTGEDFEDGCVTVTTGTITGETEFEFIVTYSSGATLSDTVTVGASYPVFVGLLPKWKTASTITMDYLEELEAEDTEGTMNRFLDEGSDLTSITFTYSFEDSSLRHIFLVIPKDYPDLVSMTTSTQEFGLEAFDVVSDITLEVDSVGDVVYKIYVYSQALSSLNQSVTFNF